MRPETYTLFVASNRRGTMRKFTVPFYALYLLAILAVVGGVSVAAAVGSYTRMLWKVGNYNALLPEAGQPPAAVPAAARKKTATNTGQQLCSLQSLATEVAMTYGFERLRNSPFGVTDSPAKAETRSFEHSVAAV